MITRVLSKKDSKRIKCQHAGCEAQAELSISVPFNVNGTKGIHFYYCCEAHRWQEAKG